VEDHLEIFKVIHPDSGKSENEILTFNFCKVKREDRDFKVVKLEKFDGGLRMTLQVQNIHEVIESVEGLKD
jgi:hypothetical protein